MDDRATTCEGCQSVKLVPFGSSQVAICERRDAMVPHTADGDVIKHTRIPLFCPRSVLEVKKT